MEITPNPVDSRAVRSSPFVRSSSPSSKASRLFIQMMGFPQEQTPEWLAQMTLGERWRGCQAILVKGEAEDLIRLFASTPLRRDIFLSMPPPVPLGSLPDLIRKRLEAKKEGNSRIWKGAGKIIVEEHIFPLLIDKETLVQKKEALTLAMKQLAAWINLPMRLNKPNLQTTADFFTLQAAKVFARAHNGQEEGKVMLRFLTAIVPVLHQIDEPRQLLEKAQGLPYYAAAMLPLLTVVATPETQDALIGVAQRSKKESRAAQEAWLALGLLCGVWLKGLLRQESWIPYARELLDYVLTGAFAEDEDLDQAYRRLSCSLRQLALLEGHWPPRTVAIREQTLKWVHELPPLDKFLEIVHKMRASTPSLFQVARSV